MTVYLHLFHGRNDPADEMDDWGFNGPTIGPLEYVHTTYKSCIKLGLEDEELCAKFQLDPHFPCMTMHEDMILWDGKYFGDWSVSTQKATGFYQFDDGPCQNLTYHQALDLFELTPGAKKLLDVGSSKPVLIKERAA